MDKTVVVVGTLDTKGRDLSFLKDLIEQEGLETIVVDFGVMGAPFFEPDITREEVARAGGSDLAYLASGERKDEAMQIMARGLAEIVVRLYKEHKLDGIIGMGGGGGTSVATAALRALPLGVPKVMVSTLAGGDVSAYAGTRDITFIPSVVDIAGLNRISRRMYRNAAGAIAGMVKMKETPPTDAEKPLIAASMFGNTTPAVERARQVMEENGYEVLIFHATGTGGKTMESLITDGYMMGVLDMTTTELADEVCGGVLSAGPERVRAAPQMNIPAVIAPGCVDMANFWGIHSVPEKYKNRNLYRWNPDITLMRTNVEENRKIGEMIAAAANAGDGPVAIVLPLKGVSMLDSPGGRFWDPPADQACFDAIKANLRSGIPVVEMDNNINDPEFAERCAGLLLDVLE